MYCPNIMTNVGCVSVLKRFIKKSLGSKFKFFDAEDCLPVTPN